MAEYRFKMPDIGEGVVEAEIVTWHVTVGDVVEEDAPLADAMTDKAVVELTAPVSGKILETGCDTGEILATGADLAVFETDTELPDPSRPAPENKASAKPETGPGPGPGSTPAGQPETLKTGKRLLASPAVRRVAREKGIDLTLVTATGPKGNITHTDLYHYQRPEENTPTALFRRKTGTTEVKVVGMRRIVSARMSEAKRRIPHFSYVESVDMTELEHLRARLDKTRKESQPKLTLIPFLVRAIVKASALWPQCNATFDDEAGIITRHHGVHAGMAAQTKNGLVVPVIRHAEALDIWQLAAEAARLGRAARDGSIVAADLSGGSITLTSLGKLGGVVTTPIINRPEVAIIGPNRMIETPVVRSGQVVIRKMMNLSSAFDHRVVDGFDAAGMILYIKTCLEHPATLFMDEE